MFRYRSALAVLVSATALSSMAGELPTIPEPERAALRAAVDDLTKTFGPAYPDGPRYLNAIDQAKDKPAFDALKREALLANPLVSAQPLLFAVHHQYRPDHHNTETFFQTGEINTASYQGGGALRLLDLRSGGRVTTLLETKDGVIRDPEVHFDGKRVVFSMRRNIEEDYHVYEINADGSGLRALTSAKGVTDLDPLYLPDDSIAFSSTREPKYCMCNRHIMANLYRMDADGSNIHQIGKSTLFEGHGSLTPDGRILYSRWEYVDRNFGDAQGLWTVFPDGTSHAVYWGNNTQSPGAVLNARVIPGTQRALCVFGSCHDRPWGALALIDRQLGVDGAVNGARSPSVLRTWPADAIELVGEGDYGRFNIDTFMKVNPKYEDPFPLSDKYFLCSRATGRGEVMGLYLLDVFGNEVLVHAEDGDDATGCFDPMPLAPHTRPPVIPARRDFENKDGYFYVADVYAGTHMAGVARGSVKALRIVASPEKRFWSTPSWDGQGQEAPAMSWNDFANKRILGTVPVEADGSAYFAVPADTFVYFQLLDENGMMVQSMRSGTIIQSGERQGCVGCHESRTGTAPTPSAPALSALGRVPSTPQPWYGPTRDFSYTHEVQPVFDKHCVACHDYGKNPATRLNLAGDRDLVFNTSYNELWRKGYIKAIGAGPAQIQPAGSWGARVSRLVDVASKPHHGVQLDHESLDRIVTWIDINAPYYPSYATNLPDTLAGRSPLDNTQVARLSALTGIKLGDEMGCAKSQGPRITFERPALSPCLDPIRQGHPDAYNEALALIESGRATLARSPRPDADAFAACPVDQRRDAKYEARKEVEARNRQAIREGTKVRDEGL